MNEVFGLMNQYRELWTVARQLVASLDELKQLQELCHLTEQRKVIGEAKKLDLVGADGTRLQCIERVLSDEMESRREEVIAKATSVLSRQIEERVAAVRESIGVEKVDTLHAFIAWVMEASGATTDVEKLKLLGMILGAVKQFSSGVDSSDVKLSLGKPSQPELVEEMVSGAL